MHSFGRIVYFRANIPCNISYLLLIHCHKKKIRKEIWSLISSWIEKNPSFFTMHSDNDGWQKKRCMPYPYTVWHILNGEMSAAADAQELTYADRLTQWRQCIHFFIVSFIFTHHERFLYLYLVGTVKATVWAAFFETGKIWNLTHLMLVGKNERYRKKTNKKKEEELESRYTDERLALVIIKILFLW